MTTNINACDARGFRSISSERTECPLSDGFQACSALASSRFRSAVSRARTGAWPRPASGKRALLVHNPEKVHGVGVAPLSSPHTYATVADVMLGWQVAAVVLMATGAPMSEAIRAMELAAARAAARKKRSTDD